MATTSAPTAASWQYDAGGNANRVAFARPGRGFFALNMDPSSGPWQAAGLDAGGLPDGTYCNVVVSDPGSCDEVVVSGGKVTLSVGALDAVAIHVDAMR